MFKAIKEILTTRAAAVIAMWVVSAMLAAGSVALTLGKAAIEDNTAALAAYEKSNATMQEGLKVVRDMAVELREAAFADKTRNLSKQVYKLTHDAADIKPVDMVGASDFCASKLYADYVQGLTGSRRLGVVKACQDVNSWLTHHPS